MPDPIPYRHLVVPEHQRFFDEVRAVMSRQVSTYGPIALSPPLWAAVCTALAESVQAHRVLAESGDPAARERLALAEALLADATNADHATDVLPPEFALDPGTPRRLRAGGADQPN